MSEKRLIVNADDFGWDKFSTEAILELAEMQKISSTSIMANFVTNADLSELNKIPGISKGLHLNLIEGKPLSEASKVRSLIDKDGNFLSQKKLLFHSLLGWIRIRELEIEISNQLNYLLNQGVAISHIDSHKHIHQYPGIGHAIIYVIKKLGIEKLRKCRPTNTDSRKMKVVGFFNKTTQKALRNFTTPEAIITDFSIHQAAGLPIFSTSIKKAFTSFNTVEFMTHPALENRKGSYLNRKAEYEFWKNEEWEEILKQKNIQLTNYNEL